MSKVLTADAILPLVASLTLERRTRLMRLIVESPLLRATRSLRIYAC
jgi:hypothetical protein